MRQLVQLQSKVAYKPAGTGLLATGTPLSRIFTDYVNSPGWAKFATYFLTATAMSGTAETIDWALSYVDPVDKDTPVATAYPGSGITQITAAGAVVLHITPYAADDDVGPVYTLNSPLPPTVKSVLTLGTSSVPEVQTIDLGDVGAADTFKIATGAGATLKTAAITWNATAATTAGLIEAALNLVYGAASVTVAAVDANTFTVTNVRLFDMVQMQVTDTATFDPKADEGYTLGVITTTAATLGDESYTLSLSVVFNS